jgi:hypothetical protein
MADEDERLYQLDTFLDSVVDRVAGLDISLLPALNDESVFVHFDSIVAAFNSMASARSACRPILLQFRDLLQQSFSASALRQLLNTFPPSLPDDPALHALTFFVLRIIRQSATPFMVLQWFAENIASPNWTAYIPPPDYPLKIACLCCLWRNLKRKESARVKYWATIDRENIFAFAKITDLGLKPLTSTMISGISEIQEKCVRIEGSDKTVWIIEPIFPSEISEWTGFSLASRPAPLPLHLFCATCDLPKTVYESFFLQLTSDDLRLLRSLMHPSVANADENQPLARALLYVFAQVGKVQALIVTLCGMDFDDESLQPHMVLRTNSHFTNLINEFITRYGESYRQKILVKLLAYIQKSGPINMRENRALAFRMLLTSLETIMKNGKTVPPQFRHMAAVLKNLSSYKFNDKRAVFNALAGFFSLRFVNEQISRLIDAENLGMRCEFLAQLSHLLQSFLSLMVYGGSDDPFVEWNEQLVTQVFPELMNFTLWLGDTDKLPPYPPARHEPLQNAIEILLQAMAENKDRVLNRYRQLADNSRERTPITWVLGSFLMSFFKNTVSD